LGPGGGLGGTRLGAAIISSCSSKGEIFYSSSDLLLANVHCFSDYSMYTPSVLVSALTRTSAPRPFVWYTACHATMRQSVARTICSCCSSHESRVHSSVDPSVVKAVNSGCRTEACWSKSLKRLLLYWKRFFERRTFCLGYSQPLPRRPIGAIAGNPQTAAYLFDSHAGPGFKSQDICEQS
jgi:hypothetical protein